tara:strand:- start:121 stop:1140 length:1020 start_codon:yes stop_codon:yes gene_type:complete
MQNDDLTIPDVLRDDRKNLCNILKENEPDEDENPICLTDSSYYTESEFTDLITSRNISEDDHLTIVSINIANLLSKLSNFKIFLGNIYTAVNKPNIICVTETHISQNPNLGYSSDDLVNIVPGYKFFHAGRRVKRGGGVGIFVQEKFASDVEINIGFSGDSNFVEEVFESISIRIPQIIKSSTSSIGKDLVILAVYRQPGNHDLDTFLPNLENWISSVEKRNHEIVITGDTNLDLLKHEIHLPTAKYLEIMSHQLIPKIVRPSRIKHQSASLIDHFFLRDITNCTISGIMATEIAGNHGYTDHMPIFLILKTTQQKIEKPKSIIISYFTESDNCEKRRD